MWRHCGINGKLMDLRWAGKQRREKNTLEKRPNAIFKWKAISNEIPRKTAGKTGREKTLIWCETMPKTSTKMEREEGERERVIETERVLEQRQVPGCLEGALCEPWSIPSRRPYRTVVRPRQTGECYASATNEIFGKGNKQEWQRRGRERGREEESLC